MGGWTSGRFYLRNAALDFGGDGMLPGVPLPGTQLRPSLEQLLHKLRNHECRQLNVKLFRTICLHDPAQGCPRG